MPRRCHVDPRLPALIAGQDFVIHRDQALAAGITRASIDHRLRHRQWQLLLPDVYLTHLGEASHRQRLVAAARYAGPRSAIDSASACRYHGITSVPREEERVYVVVPWGEPVRSHGFVVVRRTTRMPPVVWTRRLAYVEPAAAAVAATRRMRDERAVVAVLSEVVQRGIASYDDLVRAHLRGARRGARLADAALAQIGDGVRSAPEGDFLSLVLASDVLPRPLLNCLLELPDGRIISPDALFESAGLVHETNGRTAHAREDLFEDMQERHDAMTAAGLTVLHNAPRRIRREPRRVLTEVETCFLRLNGSGLPSGVRLLRTVGHLAVL